MAWNNKLVFILVAISALIPPPSAVGDILSPLSPLFSPVLNGICDIVECGKGKCVASSNQTFGFACECKPGWTKFHTSDHFGFLPCIIPNCSIDYSCTKDSVAPAPAPLPAPPTNLSIFDHNNLPSNIYIFLSPYNIQFILSSKILYLCFYFLFLLAKACMLAYCGRGKCSATSTYEHKCECNEGYSNLFNSSAYACYADCSLGADCANLGINLTNSTSASSSPSNLADNGSSFGGDLLAPTNSIWLFISVISLALVRLI